MLNPATTIRATINPYPCAKGRTALAQREHQRGGQQDSPRPKQGVHENHKDAAEHRGHVQCSWKPGSLVETKSESAAEIRQSHADQARVHCCQRCTHEHAGDSDPGIGGEVSVSVGLQQS